MTDAHPFVSSVLHPTDFSPASHQAFAHALAIAVLRRAELTLLHCGPEAEAEVPWQAFPAVRDTLANWRLLPPGSPREAVHQHLGMQVNKFSVKSSHPVAATADYLGRLPHDLVVLATARKHGFERWIQHSKAEAIARWSRTNTLFVPREARRGLIDMATGAITFRNVLVAVDHAPRADAALQYAQRAADLLAEQTVTIHTLHVGDAAPKLPPLEDGERWQWRHIQCAGDPVAQILDQARAHAADLIVLTTAGHDNVIDAFRGNTSEQIVRASDCPVLVVAAEQ
jgi:nucleotide-binding universal stress UspA family protein